MLFQLMFLAQNFFKSLDKEEGQGLVEYALIIVLIAVVVIVILTALGGQIRTVFSQIVSGLGATAQ